MSSISIRGYDPSDWPQIKDIMCAHIPKYFGKHEVDDLVKFLDQYADTFFIAENAQTIIGCGGYHLPSKSCGRLSWYLIKSGHQGQGIGGILVNHALNKLKTYPITVLEVWTSQYADHFFAKYGFTTESVVQNYWAAGIHLHKMTKNPY